MCAERKVSEEPFELLDHLGTGGFAHTYKALVVDDDLREDFGAEQVALKIPLNKKKERVLRRELEMNASLHLRLKGLQSRNLVRYLGFAVFRGQIVMAMEFVSQGSLRRIMGDIGRQKALGVDDAVRVAQGVLEGLSIIHQEHVFHRDIKPENILMEGATPKIADLGISRMLDSNELASTTTGTIYYMSPEILSEEGASFTSDIWSLGVTLYEMLTGKLPFGGRDTPIGTMADLIRRASFTVPSELAEVPGSLDEIVARAMKKDPRERYATAEEMCKALQCYKQAPDRRAEKEIADVRAMIAAGEPASAVQARIDRLVTRYPRDAGVYQCQGEFLNRCQRYAEAIDAFKKGIQFNADNALLYWDLALAYQRLGRQTDAARSLEKAMALGLDASLQRHAAMLLKVLRGPK